MKDERERKLREIGRGKEFFFKIVLLINRYGQYVQAEIYEIDCTQEKRRQLNLQI
jgi:hypothetical protein